MIFVFNDKINFYSVFENLEIIDLKNYVEDNNFKSTSYRLIGACIYEGIYNSGGHYISVCLNNKNEYFLFNDSYSRKVSFDYIKNIFPYILFYKKIAENKKDESLCISISDKNQNYINLLLTTLKNIFINQIFLGSKLTIQENLFIFNLEKNFEPELEIKVDDDLKLKLIFNKNNRKNPDEIKCEYKLTGNIEEDIKNIKKKIKSHKYRLILFFNNKINIDI